MTIYTVTYADTSALRQMAEGGDLYAKSVVQLRTDVDSLYKAVQQAAQQQGSSSGGVTPAQVVALLRLDDLTSQVNGVTTTFRTTFPYQPGLLWVWVGGAIQFGIATESSPTTGTFTLPVVLDAGTPLQCVTVRS